MSNKVFIDNPITPKKGGTKKMAYKTSTVKTYNRKPGPKKSSGGRSSTGRSKSVATKTVYKYKKNPLGLGSIKLNEALMIALGVVIVYQIPNIAIKFFSKTKVLHPTGHTNAGQPDKSEYLLWQVISIVAVYFLADTMKLKQSNKDALIGGMIAGLALQFVDQFFFNDKAQFYGYLDQTRLSGRAYGSNMVLPISNSNNRRAIPQTNGYLAQTSLGQYPKSKNVYIPFNQQTKMHA